jgi:5-methylcytosine-specific restriction endonuclease McrA
MSMDYEFNFINNDFMVIEKENNDDNDCIIVGITTAPVSQKPQIKYKKKYISSTLKRLVWNKWIGEEIGKAKCCCCNTTDIVQISFHAGHIIAEVNGGKTSISNLMPICQNCNSSMGRKNLYDFKATLK